MFGFYTNFPENLHHAERFTYSLSRKSLQQRILTAFHELNCVTLTFEQIGSPAVPKSSVIFEIGIAEGENFTFLNEAETKKMLTTISRAAIRRLSRLHQSYPRCAAA